MECQMSGRNHNQSSPASCSFIVVEAEFLSSELTITHLSGTGRGTVGGGRGGWSWGENVIAAYMCSRDDDTKGELSS